MSVTQISRIMHRRGLRIDLPVPLNDAEFGWAEDSRELFIGEGPFFGGNTQILTQYSPATLPNYTFVGPAVIEANTGVDPFGNQFERDANFPTVRSYQGKFDEFVSILDYGGIGNGSINAFPTVSGFDNAGAFYRAMQDLYSEIGGAFDDAPRKRLALRVPGGIYRITRSLLLYPFSAIIGDGIGKTIIILDEAGNGVINANAVVSPDGPQTTEIGNECVVRTCDSNGTVGAAMGTDPDGAGVLGAPVALPQDIFVAGITFLSNIPQTFGQGLKDIAKVEDAERVRFERVRFQGTWEPGDTFNGGSRAVTVASVSSGSGPVSPVTPTALSFIQCEFADTAFAFNITTDDVNDINVVTSRFMNHRRAIKLGFQDLTIDPQGGGGNPSLFRVSNSLFDNIVELGLDDRSTGPGIISSFNNFDDSFSLGQPIRFDNVTQAAVSIGDTFATPGISVCISGQLQGPRVFDFSIADTNVIMNAQDPFHTPSGFCGDIIIDGDLTVLGSLVVSGATINTSVAEVFSSTATPATHVTSATFPFADGNHIIVEYGLEIDGVYRNGTLTIIHDGSPSATTDLTYQDSYIEYNGPPLNTITIYAEANLGLSEVEVLIDVTGLPNPHSDLSFNYTARLMTV